MYNVKKLLIGEPLETERIEFERLTKKKALAVYSSDALSSVAYATEEILRVLVLAGISAFAFSLPIAISIVLLLTIVTLSYKQTIFAYPGGGGSYIVAKENLGVNAGLVAGAALLIDYILTVAVSTAAGVAALTSAFPQLLIYREAIGVFFILIVTLANLRGVRESADIFAIPTYLFIIGIFVLIGGGIYKYISGGFVILPVQQHSQTLVTHGLTLFLLLRGFAAGCTALTGIEAISNGITSFKKPETHNATKTLIAMSTILTVMFLGITFLAHIFGVAPSQTETVVSQIGVKVFGRGMVYYYLQSMTVLILILAANTSFSGFPRLASILAKDGFAPRLLAILGDRLVYSNGIIFLGLFSAFLVVIFRGDTNALLPLYAVGVFLSFTLSQSGMVVHWFKLKDKGWQKHALINATGAFVTFIATGIIAVTKFEEGAWLVVVFIPIYVAVFKAVNRHYKAVAKQLTSQGYVENKEPLQNTVIVPIGSLNRVVLNTLRYAHNISDNVVALHISIDKEATETLKRKWAELDCKGHLEIMPSPYRSLVTPLLKYIEMVEEEAGSNGVVTVLLPEFIPRKWWQYFLHNQTGLLIKTTFFLRKDTLITSVPYHLKE